VEAPDPLRDGLEVGQQAAEPALVHVRHAAAVRGLLDRVPGLLLGADEQHGAAAAGELPGELLRIAQEPLGLLQVDDVYAAALAEDEAAHLGVPAARLVAEVDPGLQQLLDADIGGQRETPLWLMSVARRAACGPEIPFEGGLPPSNASFGRPKAPKR
jgi:hypothetical protein